MLKSGLPEEEDWGRERLGRIKIGEKSILGRKDWGEKLGKEI
jgi:hypothetical protein